MLRTALLQSAQIRVCVFMISTAVQPALNSDAVISIVGHVWCYELRASGPDCTICVVHNLSR